MVAVTFFGTEIFDSRICFFMKKKGDQEFKYTEFTLKLTLGTCRQSLSLTRPKFTDIENLECQRMNFKASNQW